MKLQELVAKIESEVNFDYKDMRKVTEMSIKYISLYHYYNDMYRSALYELGILKIKKEEVYGKLYHKYKFENGAGGYALDTKSEVELYVRKDPEYIKVAKEYVSQESIVDFLEKTLANINNIGHSVRNRIELEKLQMGV